MEAKASSKYLRVSSQKVNLVLELIRNKKTSEAIAILEQTNKKAAPLVLKVFILRCIIRWIVFAQNSKKNNSFYWQ